MLTAEKQVSRVFRCTITQERHSQLHLILLLWHPPAQWDIVTLNPSVFSKARQAHSSQDSWDILVPVCKQPRDLKVSVCLVSRIPQPRSSIPPSLSLSLSHTHTYTHTLPLSLSLSPSLSGIPRSSSRSRRRYQRYHWSQKRSVIPP